MKAGEALHLSPRVLWVIVAVFAAIVFLLIARAAVSRLRRRAVREEAEAVAADTRARRSPRRRRLARRAGAPAGRGADARRPRSPLVVARALAGRTRGRGGLDQPGPRGALPPGRSAPPGAPAGRLHLWAAPAGDRGPARPGRAAGGGPGMRELLRNRLFLGLALLLLLCVALVLLLGGPGEARGSAAGPRAERLAGGPAVPGGAGRPRLPPRRAARALRGGRRAGLDLPLAERDVGRGGRSAREPPAARRRPRPRLLRAAGKPGRAGDPDRAGPPPEEVRKVTLNPVRMAALRARGVEPAAGGGDPRGAAGPRLGPPLAAGDPERGRGAVPLAARRPRDRRPAALPRPDLPAAGRRLRQRPAGERRQRRPAGDPAAPAGGSLDVRRVSSRPARRAGGGDRGVRPHARPDPPAPGRSSTWSRSGPSRAASGRPGASRRW